MADWEKLKVIELKEELKTRGIPLTGLKLKQQLIDKLVEVEAQLDESSAAGQNGGQNEEGADGEEKSDKADSHNENAVDKESTVSGDANDETNVDESDDPHTESAVPPILEKEESNARDEEPPNTSSIYMADAEQIQKDDPFFLETTNESTRVEDQPEKLTMNEDSASQPPNTLKVEDGYEPKMDVDMTLDSVQQSDSSDWRHMDQQPAAVTEQSIRVPTPEILSDPRKRKRRSTSPSEVNDIAQKKVKVASDEGAFIQDRGQSLAKIREATHNAELSRQPNDSVKEEPLQPMEASNDPERTRVAQEVGGLPTALELQNKPAEEHLSALSRSRSLSTQSVREISPARHPATSSLYIRNFKRPLHIPTLRQHVSSLAQSSRSSADGEAIKVFYLDNIRTHAFISFTSISAASRVRNAMHNTRFPDEAMREPLWIDFVPDEEVQSWIDEETGGSGRGIGAGRNTNRKYEVVYDNGGDGVRAQLHDMSGMPARPTFPQRKSISTSQTVPNTPAVASGIHPDRVALVPQVPAKLPAKSDSGTGFKALDELFQYTSAKPRLYFKLPDQSVIDDRFDMIRGLQVGHSDMGRSGDEGMKRYTFEEYRGREEWVDKGPEFGFGRKGQDRLAGVRGRGGFRGGRRGADSWRGR